MISGAHFLLYSRDVCDDLGTAISTLRDRGVPIGSVGQAEWGSFTTVTLPSGGAVGL